MKLSNLHFSLAFQLVLYSWAELLSISRLPPLQKQTKSLDLLTSLNMYSIHFRSQKAVSTCAPYKNTFLPLQSSSSELCGEIGLTWAERFITQALRTPQEQIRAEF